MQIQPELSSGIDMTGLTERFRDLLARKDLVRRHAFDHGEDDGSYYNFTFGTDRPAELWRVMQASIFQAPPHRAHLAAAAMAMCSGEEGWDTYVQLCHWDPEVPVVSADDL